jgi:hypothetical protein
MGDRSSKGGQQGIIREILSLVILKNKSIEENTDAELSLGHSGPKDGFKLMETMKEGCKVLGLLSLLVGQEDDHEEMHLAREEDGHSFLMKLKLEGDEIQASLDLYPGPM